MTFSSGSHRGTTTREGYIDIVDEQLIFCDFSLKSLCSKYVVTICKFYKLYGDFWCRGFGWRVIIWVTYGAQYVRFEHGVAMAPLGPACA